jgi:hypothetical protein
MYNINYNITRSQTNYFYTAEMTAKLFQFVMTLLGLHGTDWRRICKCLHSSSIFLHSILYRLLCYYFMFAKLIIEST